MLSFSTVEEYIATETPEKQEILERVRAIVKECVPDVQEKISYRMPTFLLNGRVIVHVYACKNHLGFYPEADGVEAFKDKLVDYKTSKGCIQFPYKKPIPYDLIREIVQYKFGKSFECKS